MAQTFTLELIRYWNNNISNFEFWPGISLKYALVRRSESFISKYNFVEKYPIIFEDSQSQVRTIEWHHLKFILETIKEKPWNFHTFFFLLFIYLFSNRRCLSKYKWKLCAFHH